MGSWTIWPNIFLRTTGAFCGMSMLRTAPLSPPIQIRFPCLHVKLVNAAAQGIIARNWHDGLPFLKQRLEPPHRFGPRPVLPANEPQNSVVQVTRSSRSSVAPYFVGG